MLIRQQMETLNDIQSSKMRKNGVSVSSISSADNLSRADGQREVSVSVNGMADICPSSAKMLRDT